MNPIVTVTGFWDAFVTKIAVFLPNLFFCHCDPSCSAG